MDKIIINGLCKSFRKKLVLNNINLELDRGKCYGFYGRNGSGKTMLFRAISGLMRIDSGEINVFGESIGKAVAFPSSIGITIENVGFWKSMTGFENLKILAVIKNKITDEDIIHSLERVGLGDSIHALYKTYSLGMRQKLAIAQAIMESPTLLILDEPTNSLDEQSVLNVANILAEEKAKGVTTLLCSHNKEDIRATCDEVFTMDNGSCFRRNEAL